MIRSMSDRTDTNRIANGFPRRPRSVSNPLSDNPDELCKKQRRKNITKCEYNDKTIDMLKAKRSSGEYILLTVVQHLQLMNFRFAWVLHLMQNGIFVSRKVGDSFCFLAALTCGSGCVSHMVWRRRGTLECDGSNGIFVFCGILNNTKRAI